MNGSHQIIISFNEEEVIESKTHYTLKAVVNNVENDDSVVTGFNSEDDFTPLSGLSALNQENTGQLYSMGDATTGIFTVDSDFSQSIGTDRHFIWSDRSAAAHSYASVNNGIVSNNTGSGDWTNGYGLKLNAFSPQILSK